MRKTENFPMYYRAQDSVCVSPFQSQQTRTRAAAVRACYVVCAHFGMLSPSSLCFFPVSAARDISDLGEKRSLFVSRLFKGAIISAYMAKVLQSAITLPCNGADKSEIWAL